jgi:hypothetical protein
MSTTDFVSGVASFDDFIAPPRNFRSLALGATALGCGVMAAVVLVMASMAVTSTFLDALSASPDLEEKAAARPSVFAKSEATPNIAPSAQAAASIPAEPVGHHGSIADAKLTLPPALAANVPVAAVQSPMPPPPAPASAAPALMAIAPSVTPGSVPRPPSRSTIMLTPPTTIPRSAPPQPIVAATSAAAQPPAAFAPLVTAPVVSASPSVVSTESLVPLPPKRPAGSIDISLAPKAEFPPPAALRPDSTITRSAPAEAKPQISETQLQKSAAAPNTAAPPQDNRSFFQKLFGALSGSSSSSLSALGSRTALYDISAHTVYLPSGERLEAHSGLGSKLDDPRTIHDKNRGVTPPNIYQLSLRKQLFHGVAALRLTPASEDKMFGRDGMLAHTYMLGARGDSNGCISLKDYMRFLQAYRSGEITRLIVVAQAGDAPLSVASAHPDRELQ